MSCASWPGVWPYNLGLILCVLVTYIGYYDSEAVRASPHRGMTVQMPGRYVTGYPGHGAHATT
jgi:hypothetical protein